MRRKVPNIPPNGQSISPDQPTPEPHVVHISDNSLVQKIVLNSFQNLNDSLSDQPRSTHQEPLQQLSDPHEMQQKV